MVVVNSPKYTRNGRTAFKKKAQGWTIRFDLTMFFKSSIIFTLYTSQGKLNFGLNPHEVLAQFHIIFDKLLSKTEFFKDKLRIILVLLIWNYLKW